MDDEDVQDTPEPGFVAKKLPQYLAAVSAGIGGLVLGSSLGWSSPFLTDIETETTENVTNQEGKYETVITYNTGSLGDVSETEKSFIASSVALGAFLSSLFAGYIIERFGRRMTLMFSAPPCVAGWLLIIFANGVPMLISGRVITGLMGGIMTLTSPLFVAEIAEDHIRGVLGSLFMVMVVLGTIATYGVGAITTWRVMSSIDAVAPVILFVCIFFIPESPVFLLRKNRTKEARTSLRWLRGALSDSDIEPELEKMQKNVDESLEHPVKFRDLLGENVRKPTIIAIMLVFFNQLTGIQAVLAYAGPIIESTKVNINPDLAAILLGICVMVASAFMDMAGRRTFLLLSEMGMTLSFVAVGTFYYLMEHNGDEAPKNLSWLPIVGLIIYIMSYAIGMGPLPRIVLSEILPLKYKGSCASIAYMVNWLAAFAVIMSTQDLQNLLNDSGFFWLYSGICLVAFIIIYFTVPETKGLPLAEIQLKFEKNLK